MTPEQPMKVIYFEGYFKSPIHAGQGSRGQYLYVPNEDVCLFKALELDVVQQFGLIRNQNRLNVARSIARGETPSGDNNIIYSNIREFEYDNSKLQALIQDARLQAELQTKVQSGIEELLEQAK